MKRRAPQRPVIVVRFDDGTVERVDALETALQLHSQLVKLSRAKDDEMKRLRADLGRYQTLRRFDKEFGYIKDRQRDEQLRAALPEKATARRVQIAAAGHAKILAERDWILRALDAADEHERITVLQRLGCPHDAIATFGASNVAAFLAKRHRKSVRQMRRILKG